MVNSLCGVNVSAVCPSLVDGYSFTVVRAATLRQHLLIKLAVSPNHSIPTPGQPVLALTP